MSARSKTAKGSVPNRRMRRRLCSPKSQEDANLGENENAPFENNSIKLFKLGIINLNHIMGVGEASRKDLDSHLQRRRKDDRQKQWQSPFSKDKTIVDEGAGKERFEPAMTYWASSEGFSFAWEVEVCWCGRGIAEVHA